MMSEVLQRSVSIGSKAPDPVDHFLERHLLYRKHMVMDPSCLFRVIAEQVYDSQMLHHEVRMECVRYMFRKRRSFRRFVSGDYDEYLWQLELARTPGTMLELRALAHLYRRNIIIYKPFDLGRLVIDRKDYPETLRIFVSNRGHFDSVLEKSDIEMAAIAQAVAFKMLYKHFFRLPDIDFAVEWMLYPETFRWGTDLEFDPLGNVIRLLCRNGRSFKLDRPENTRCILANYRECPFHNPNIKLGRYMMSCMRRFLERNRPPISYMTAKSLDPYMYRNVELSCLNKDIREGNNSNVYKGDYDFKVGAKCQVELEAKRQLSVCHIQAINEDKSSCLVFVEGQGKFQDVPYKNLHPPPPSEFQPWDCQPKKRFSRNRRNQLRRIKRQRQKEQWQRQMNQRQDFKETDPGPKKQSQPTPPVKCQVESRPDQQISTVPSVPQFSTPPPQAIPRPVFLPAPPPLFGPPGIMTHQLMIRPPGPIFYVTPPRVEAPTGLMPLPFVVRNSSVMINSVNEPKPPPT
ncbi:protein ovarian tumor locus isoform X2 [Drosophila subpulchrella]|uniref:protein ovarian tumor locus isoform X2 n=1 Tax=Drosophila subpulchrella TaxID=1486046 RepID=UPI0018A17D0A|nr:protein ovarian tumor locus isoform X2 [Drosophila subpulchrella]